MSLTVPAIGAVAIPGDLLTYRPVSSITPFTYRSGITYQALLEALRVYVTQDLTDYLTDEFGEFAESWKSNVDTLIEAVNTALADQATDIAAQLSETLAEIIAGANVALNDAAVLSALQKASSTSLAYLDGRFAPKSLVARVDSVEKSIKRTRFDVIDFGAIGDGSANDTAAVQAAVTAALAANDPIDVQVPKFNGQAATVYFPKGTYLVDQINIPGSLRLQGDATFAYAASTLLQRTAGQSIFQLKADTDGTSNATVIERLCFRSGVATSNSESAHIRTDQGIGSNSVYIRNCWFGTPERYSIWIKNGDDIKIKDCTFDVSPFHAVKLGSDATHGCSNVEVHGNTFFDIALRCIDIVNCDGLSIVGNKAYKGYQSQPSVFMETVDATKVRGVTMTGNQISSIKIPLHLFAAKCRNIVFTGNVINGNFDSALVVEGGLNDILQALVMSGNSIDNSNAMDGGSAFRCQSAAIQASVISHNSVNVQNGTALVFNMPNASTSNNYFRQNPYVNFSNYDNFASGTNNG